MIGSSHHSSTIPRASRRALSIIRYRLLLALLLPGSILMISSAPVTATPVCKGEADKSRFPGKGMAPPTAQPVSVQTAIAILEEGLTKRTALESMSSLDITDVSEPKNPFSQFFVPHQ
jgi:hypothetical protein